MPYILKEREYLQLNLAFPATNMDPYMNPIYFLYCQFLQVYRHPSRTETTLRVIRNHSNTVLGRQYSAIAKKHLLLFEVEIGSFFFDMLKLVIVMLANKFGHDMMI